METTEKQSQQKTSVRKISTLTQLQNYEKLNKNIEIYDAEELGLPEVVMLRDNDKGVDYFFSIEEGGKLFFEEEQYPDKAKEGWIDYENGDSKIFKEIIN
jgi:hypothetical protein